MKFFSRQILIIFCLLAAIRCYGYSLRQFTNADGLSNSAVLSLYQDQDGFLWLGTCDGLNLYDGIDIRPLIFSKGKTLSGNMIENILETEKGTLWIQTNYGLDKLDKYKRDITSYTQFQGSYTLKKNPRNEIFVLSDKNRIHYLAASSNVFQELSIPELDTSHIVDIHLSDHFLWVFTTQGILKCQLVHSETAYTVKHVVKVDSTPLLHCFTKGDTAYLIDTRHILYEYQIEEERKASITDLTDEIAKRGKIADIIRDNDDFCIAFQTDGVIKLTAQQGKCLKEDLGIKSGIFCLLKGCNQNIVWIGTDGQGAYLYSDGRYSIQSITYNNLKFNIAKPVRSIFMDKDNSLWLGTKGEGILKIYNYDFKGNIADCRTELITNTNSDLADNSVYAFAESSRPLFWIGSDKGINYYSYTEKRIKNLPCEKAINYVHAIYEEHDSILWMATVGTGIIRARIEGSAQAPRLTNIKRYTIHNGNFSSNYFFTLYRDNSGELYFGNRGYGTFVFKEGKLHPVPLKKAYKGNTVNDVFSIIKDNDTLWLGTSYGLIKQTADDERCFNKENGFQNSTIHAMLGDDSNNIWIATNNGLARFQTNNNNIQNYNRRNGLNIIEFSDGAAWKSRHALFFGGTNGLAVIQENPDYRIGKEYIAPIRFIRLNVLGKEENLYDYMQTGKDTPKLVLDYTQNYFTISYIATDYINANNYTYLYKIDQDGNKWIDNGPSNSISFTQMSPGDYRLYIKYKNRTTGEESNVYSLLIHIQPPWYLSNTAILAYQILLFTFIIILIRMYLVKQQKKQKQMVYLLEQAHKEEVYEEKLRFFTNITHEFCTPLTLIYGPCERILSYPNTDSFIRKYIMLIKQNAERLNSLIQEVIDFRRIETGHKKRNIKHLLISQICNDIIGSFTDLAEQNQIKLENHVEAGLYWNSDQNCLTKILTNLISNAFKYTPIGGTIRITLSVENGKLLIAVYNTGKGIEKEKIPLIFNRYTVLDNIEENAVKGLSSRNGLGMAICQSMVELLEGEIQIKSEVNQYAEFLVILPELKLPSHTETVEKSDGQQEQTQLITAPIAGISLSMPACQPNEQTDTQKKTILVIDDNTEILTLLQEALADTYRVVTAQNGEEGLKILKMQYPELIVTDIMMQGTNGITLTRLIKQNKHTMHIPLIILSAKTTNEEKIEGLESGADAYIGKPFNLNYLKAIIARLIENQNKMKEYYNSSACAFEFTNGQLMKKEDKDFMQNVSEFIGKNLENTELCPEDLANHLQISIRNLYRKFKELNQLSPKDFIKDYRINVATKLLKTTTLTVQEIIYQCGFNNRSHFYKEFDKRFQMTPREYRSKYSQKDETLPA